MYLQNELGHSFPCLKLSDSSLDLSGSAGLPYKFIDGIECKKDVLDAGLVDEDSVLSHASKVGYHVEPFYQWDCFPKIEILESEKANRKTRIICGASIEHCLLGSYVSDSLNLALNSKPLLCKSAIGLSLNRGGWNQLANYVGKNVHECDAKQWDSSMHSLWLHGVYRVREALMRLNDEQRQILWFWFSELNFSYLVHSYGSCKYVIGGNKSGSPNTCHDNTIGHIMLVAYCFSCMGKSYGQFVRFRVALFGDDYLSEPIDSEFYKFYQSFGVRISEPITKPLSSASFLSFRFLETPYGYMPFHKNSKMLFSAYNHDSKKWMLYRDQKLFLLAVLNYWHPDGPLYFKILDEYKIPYSIPLIVYYWTGFLVGGGFKCS